MAGRTSKGPGMNKSSFLGQSKLRRYNPSLLARQWSLGHDGHRGYYTIGDAEAMKRDPQVRFALRILYSPLSKVEWEIDADDADSGEQADIAFRRIWERHRAQLFQSVIYGWLGCEVEYGQDQDGSIIFDQLEDIHPLDCRPLRQGRRLAGLSLVNLAQNAGDTVYDEQGIPTHWILPPRSLWLAYEPEFGSFYGRGKLATMWLPWREKTGRHGAWDIRRMWYLKNAYRGGTMRFPEGERDDGTGNLQSNIDYAMQLVESEETGGVKVLPGERDADGRYVWEYEPPAVNGDVKGVLEYVQELDTDILRACQIPPEVVQAATVGSGWSGRSVPFLVFLDMVDDMANAIAQPVWEQIVRPMVAANRGEQAARDVQLRLKSLVPEEAGPDGGQAGAGGGGMPGVPQAAQGGGGQGGEWVPHRGKRGGMGLRNPVTGQIRYGARMALDTPMLSLDEAIWLANDTAHRNVGDKWEGPSGRWFSKREDGRVVPIPAPGSEQDPRAQGQRKRRADYRERQKAEKEKEAQERLARPAESRVQGWGGVDTEKTREVLQEMFGTAEMPPEMVGAQSGSELDVYQYRQYEGAATRFVEVRVDHPAIKDQSRTLTLTEDGELRCSNNLFILEKEHRGLGLGLKVFSEQVQSLAGAGADAIVTYAGKGGIMTGYYTWPRLGYDAPLEERFRNLLARGGDSKRIRKALLAAGVPEEEVDDRARGVLTSNPRTVLDLMATPDGRAIWKGAGYMTEMKFDLKPGSRSLEVLNAYLGSKGKPPIEVPPEAEQKRQERKERAEKAKAGRQEEGRLQNAYRFLAEEIGNTASGNVREVAEHLSHEHPEWSEAERLRQTAYSMLAGEAQRAGLEQADVARIAERFAQSWEAAGVAMPSPALLYRQAIRNYDAVQAAMQAESEASRAEAE